MPGTDRELSGLEKTAKTIGSARNMAGVILPAFQREDLGEHVNTLLHDNPTVESYVRRNPSYRKTLQDIADRVYKDHGKYIVGAKLIDSMDRITATVGELQEVFPGVGNVMRVGENTIELLPKLAYVTWYANGTNDYKAFPYFAALEAASFVPYAGELIDFANLYTARARKTFRNKVGDEFLKSVRAKASAPDMKLPPALPTGATTPTKRKDETIN